MGGPHTHIHLDVCIPGAIVAAGALAKSNSTLCGCVLNFEIGFYVAVVKLISVLKFHSFYSSNFAFAV